MLVLIGSCLGSYQWEKWEWSKTTLTERSLYMLIQNTGNVQKHCWKIRPLSTRTHDSFGACTQNMIRSVLWVNSFATHHVNTARRGDFGRRESWFRTSGSDRNLPRCQLCNALLWEKKKSASESLEETSPIDSWCQRPLKIKDNKFVWAQGEKGGETVFLSAPDATLRTWQIKWRTLPSVGGLWVEGTGHCLLITSSNLWPAALEAVHSQNTATFHLQ